MRSTNEIQSNRNIVEQTSPLFFTENEQPRSVPQDTMEQFSVEDLFSKASSGQPISDEILKAIEEANMRVIQLARQVRA